MHMAEFRRTRETIVALLRGIAYFRVPAAAGKQRTPLMCDGSQHLLCGSLADTSKSPLPRWLPV